MAQPIACDICSAEEAVQMLTNLQDGQVLALGPACLPTFYGQSVLMVTGAGEHAGPRTKCKACSVIHDTMTGTATPIADVSRETPDEIPGQLTVDEAAGS